MLTPFQIAQLVVAAAIPVSLWVVTHQIRDVKWTRLTPAIVVNVFLAVFILTGRGAIQPVGAAFITTLLLGHTTTYLDND
ncbi:MAG: hypothetical protein ABEJ59_00015 [Halanaeroarchaeum sp.]